MVKIISRQLVQMKRFLLLFLGILILTFRLNAQSVIDTASMVVSDSLTVAPATIKDDDDEKPFMPPPPSKEQIDYENTTIKQRNFDKNKWHDLTKDLDYSIEEQKKKDKKKDTGSWLTNEQLQVFVQLFKAIFWILAGALVLFLIYQIANNGSIFFRRARKITLNNDASTIHIDEEDIQNNDFDALIGRALAQKNYVMAVRLYYMAILKELDTKGNIKWEKEKTNGRYLTEMKTHDLVLPFKNCTNLFDTFFYGQRVLDEPAFAKIQPEFQSLYKILTEVRKPDGDTGEGTTAQ